MKPPKFYMVYSCKTIDAAGIPTIDIDVITDKVRPIDELNDRFYLKGSGGLPILSNEVSDKSFVNYPKLTYDEAFKRQFSAIGTIKNRLDEKENL